MTSWQELIDLADREIAMLNAEMLSRKIKITKLRWRKKYYARKIAEENRKDL